MTQWIRVAAKYEIPPGCVRELVAGDHIVAVANIDGHWLAIDGVCPHQGGPLGKGQLTGSIVTCPWHGWQFDLRTGQHCLNRNLHHPKFDVRVDDENIYVAVDPL